MKKYTFTGKHKKNNIFEKYYTSNEFIATTINIFKNLNLPDIHFIDTSAGDNRLVKALVENNLISSYKSFDISFSNISFGEIEMLDWCAFSDSKNDAIVCDAMVGFNPPYGYNNKMAKKFIKKAWKECHKYCIWLVPPSVEPYLLEMYETLHLSSYTDVLFDKLKQSVILFVGKRRSIILSKNKKQKSIPKHNYSIERNHYKGIADDVSLIIKKTGNPVLFPLFYKTGEFWSQYYNGVLVTDKAKIIEKDGKKYMRGISRNKNGDKVFEYAIESNVYFRISNIENIVNMDWLIETLMELGKSDDFYKFTNKYKPAAITKGWFIDYLNILLEKV